MENNLQQTSHVSARLFSKLFSITRPQSSSSIYMRFKRWLAKIYCNKVATPVISREVLLYYSLLKNPSKKNGKRTGNGIEKGVRSQKGEGYAYIINLSITTSF